MALATDVQGFAIIQSSDHIRLTEENLTPFKNQGEILVLCLEYGPIAPSFTPSKNGDISEFSGFEGTDLFCVCVDTAALIVAISQRARSVK